MDQIYPSAFKRAISHLTDLVVIVLFQYVYNNGSFKLGYTGYIILFLYYFIFEILFRKTLGKFITGLIVVSVNDTSLTAKDLFIRTLCRFIPFNFLSFLFTSNQQFWHDNISNTAVVKSQYETETNNSFADDCTVDFDKS